MLHWTVRVVLQLIHQGRVLCPLFWVQWYPLQYEAAHKTFEDNFWSTKMGLEGASNEALARTKTDYESVSCRIVRCWARLRQKLQLHAAGCHCMSISRPNAVLLRSFPGRCLKSASGAEGAAERRSISRAGGLGMICRCACYKG